MLCQVAVGRGPGLPRFEQLVCNIQAGQHRDAVERTATMRLPQFPQFAVQIGRCRNQTGPLFRRAGNQVLTIENA